MKILSSQTDFSTEHYKNISEKYTSSTQTRSENNALSSTPTVDVIDLSYSAKMRSEQANKVESQSHVKLGNDHTSYNNNQATHAITQTIVGAGASIRNLAITEGTSALIDPQQTKAYTNVEQLPASDTLAIKRFNDTEAARVDIKEQHTLYESERLHVGAQGRVTTADGREIDFMLKLEMQRNFRLEESLNIQSGQRELHDPLIINFEGGATSLTSSSFSFDLNADGSKEEISFVQPGSGFLALDQNGDGRINDGSELFGAGDKNGFAELAQHDDDSNKWIDENDEVFSKLKIWTQNENGIEQLMTLKEAGVGAIYLGSSAATFDIKDAENNLLGQVKRSGVFLTEKGEVASIQELDLAVHDTQKPSAIEQSLNNIDEQVEQWDEQGEKNRQQSLALNLISNPTSLPSVDDENKLPSLLDLLFPAPGSKYDHANERKRTQSVEQQSSVKKSQQGKFNVKDKEDDSAKKIAISGPTLDVLKRLDEKTAEQLTADTDKNAYLRDIIESLIENQQQQKLILEQQEGKTNDTSSTPE